MPGGKLFCGAKATRRNARCDRRRSPPASRGEDFVDVGYLFRPFFKKRGGGKGDWGLPGDEMVEAPVDPRDPSCESDWSDAELEEALREHLQPRADEARSPTSQDDYVMVYAATPDDAGAAVTVDCDKPAAAAAAWTHEASPKGSWLHGFGEPTPLKLPANAVWPEVPSPDEVSTHVFFFD